MNIVVVGCGKIGGAIVASLVEEGHNVIAVDNDPKVLSDIENIYDVMTVCGSGTDCEVLKDAGIWETELLVAVTSSDELNMLSCFISKKMGAKHTIARIRKPEYNMTGLGFLKEQLDISLVLNPELLAAHEIYNIIKFPSAVKIETFSRRSFEIVEIIIREDSPLADTRLADIRNKFKAKLLVCDVQRGDAVCIPDGNFILRTGDRIGITTPPSETGKMTKALGLDRKQAKNIMLVGGSRIAYYLARVLGDSGHRVKIIEKDPQRCDELSELLPKAVIINGDGASQEVLTEEGLGSTDAFVALTGMDEENILISILAASRDVKTVIAKINRSELAEMARNLGLECVISPKETVSSILSQYARALENSMGSNVETLYKIMDGKAEVLEFNVSSDFGYIRVPLSELKIKENILVAGIFRNGSSVLPTGSDFILPGDRVIVVTAGHRLNDLSDMFR